MTLRLLPLFTPWWFGEEHGLLFDRREGLTAPITQRAHEVKIVVLSQAAREYLTGRRPPRVAKSPGCASYDLLPSS